MPLGLNIPEEHMRQEVMSQRGRAEPKWPKLVTCGSGPVYFLKSPRGWTLSPAASHQPERNHHVHLKLNQSNCCGAGAKGHLEVWQAVIGRQAAVVGGHTWDKVVQQVLAGHQQTGNTDQYHMQPLVPAKTSRLTMATRLNENQLQAASLLSRMFQVRGCHSPPPGAHWSPSLDLLCFPFNVDCTKYSNDF